MGWFVYKGGGGSYLRGGVRRTPTLHKKPLQIDVFFDDKFKNDLIFLDFVDENWSKSRFYMKMGLF